MRERVTVEWVEDRVMHVAEAVGDNERAHLREDDLYVALLRAIASGECDDPAECARAALATQQLGFDRWYA